MRTRSVGFLMALVVAAASAAACGGGVTTGGATSSPTPSGTNTPGGSPTPTPAQQRTVCSFLWAGLVSASTFNIYEVDVDSTLWNTGTVTLDGQKADALYLLNADQQQNFTAAGMATAGTVSITANGTTVGSQAGFNDTATLTYFDAYAALKGQSNVLGPQTGTGGVGSFSGQLSDLSGTSPTPGTGSVAATISGSPVNFNSIALAGCQTVTAFAPQDRYARAMANAQLMMQFLGN